MTQSYVINTGINLDDVKSSEIFTGDLFICSLYDLVSNWRCSETLSEYLGMSIVMGMRKDLITDLSCSKSYELKDNTDLEWEFSADSGVQRLHMVAYGFGAKNILRSIASYGCKITVVPSTNLSSEVLHLKPDDMLFSNGSGGQSAVPYAVEIVQDLVGKVPGFGNCMGHQQLGQALGGSTFKTNFGHHDESHSVGHPVHLPTGRV